MPQPIGGPSALPAFLGGAPQARPAKPPRDREAAGRAMDRDRAEFGRRDQDGDGYLGRADYGRGRESRLALRRADVDGDRRVSFGEYRAAERLDKLLRRGVCNPQGPSLDLTAPPPAQAAAPPPPAPPAPPPTIPYTTAYPHPVAELAQQLASPEQALRDANGWGPEMGQVPGRTPIQVPDTPETRAAVARYGQPAPAKPGEAPPPVTGDQAPPASPHTAHLLGAMDARQIEDVLAARGSRFAGQGFGEFILGMERKYGVPAVQFLAMATMESQIGGDDGYAQPGHNVGNLRPGDSWTGPVVDGPYGRFRVYDSWEAGIEDYFRLLAGPIYAGKSLQDQIFTYAPPSDGNDSWHYLDQVQKLVLQWSGLQA